MYEMIQDGDDMIMVNVDYDMNDYVQWSNGDYIPEN